MGAPFGEVRPEERGVDGGDDAADVEEGDDDAEEFEEEGEGHIGSGPKSGEWQVGCICREVWEESKKQLLRDGVFIASCAHIPAPHEAAGVVAH